ncbi:MAG: ATP-dependent transcriptional regulator [Cereibacter sphaeroides]|uniref:ATP-dependent transcriptional regulator n=1 Tax=Cereibacter sphaeroides TaxID=1063 RepID=A0A2W5UNN8_CERSP|nr:MAG: ATP-dependent transcriptional regulator [Cereibacter sphaeroides]
MRFTVAIALFALLSACAQQPADVPQRRATEAVPLPPMKTFAPTRGHAPQRSNASIARDILALEFQMESGRDLPWLTRFDGPVTITMTGKVPPTAPHDLGQLIGRLRWEAGIDITPVPRGPASITVEFLPRARLQSIVPAAACFVAPRVSSWAEYRQSRRSDKVDWTTLPRREKVAVFIPSDTSPQEVRDCLHEEVAQALGPLNDLYQLSDSVFNDDNFHTVLTGFDMLVLRVHYAPELANGMSKAAVAAKLPQILVRLNPAGGPGYPLPPSPTPRAWIDAIERALGPRGTARERRMAAQQAVDIARAQGWRDSRAGFSYFALGRLSLADEIDLAVISLAEASQIYATLPDAEIHRAHIDMQMAAFALSASQPDEAIRLADRAAPVAMRAENAALLASLLMLKAEALQMQGRVTEAQALRLDSLGWARYGFGADGEVRDRLSEISVLSPGSAG